MKIAFKTLCSSFAIILGLTANFAQAQEAEETPADTTKPRAILFKIHDIKPVINSEGIVTDCDFVVTFYNRTNESFRSAKLVLGWNDDVSDRFITDELAEPKPVPVNRYNSRQSQPAMEISTTVEMPALNSYKQASVAGTVKTEKCFLLLDKIDFQVEECNMIGKEETSVQNTRRQRLNANRNANECSSLFEYVDSKNPEYYDEFKNISYSEQERILNGVKLQDTTDIQNTYDSVTSNLNKISEILESIN